MFDLLLAVVLAAAGLAVFGYLGSLLWQAAAEPLAGTVERARLKRCEDLVVRGDTALSAGDLRTALESFASAVYGSPVRSATMASAVEKHHTGILSRFIAASDRRRGENVGLLSLALVDRVLRKRKALQSSYVAALQTGSRGRRRKLERELKGNTRELRKAMKDLAAEVQRAVPGASLH